MTTQEKIEAKRKDIQIMDTLCAAAGSDGAYRGYAARRDEFMKELVALEKQTVQEAAFAEFKYDQP